jgi:hypothetical protein
MKILYFKIQPHHKKGEINMIKIGKIKSDNQCLVEECMDLTKKVKDLKFKLNNCKNKNSNLKIAKSVFDTTSIICAVVLPLFVSVLLFLFLITSKTLINKLTDKIKNSIFRHFTLISIQIFISVGGGAVAYISVGIPTVCMLIKQKKRRELNELDRSYYGLV